MSLAYLLKRLGFIVVTLFLVSTVIFAITQLLPGNAAQMVLGQFATPEQIHALERQMGLDQPWYGQYWHWLSGIVSLNWGLSMVAAQPVFPLVMQALGRSLILAFCALVTVTVIAIPLGVVAAENRGKPIDFGVSIFTYLGTSVPEFVSATLLLVLLARPEVGLFPAGGYVPLAEGGIWAFLNHLILPTGSLAIILVAHISRQTRSEMIDVLHADYIRTAVLKGLPWRTVVIKHGLRNGMLPTITVIALDIGYLIGGILVVEEVFAYPGLGRLMIASVQNRDLPVIQAGSLVLASFYAFANLSADLIYAWLDRRIQYG